MRGKFLMPVGASGPVTRPLEAECFCLVCGQAISGRPVRYDLVAEAPVEDVCFFAHWDCAEAVVDTLRADLKSRKKAREEQP